MNVFAAISDPTRRSILDLVLKHPMSVGEIKEEFPSITQPGLSKHLGVLRRAKLVKVTVMAQKRVYSLNDFGFHEIDNWIAKYQKFWNKKLDSLEDFLDNNDPQDMEE